MLYLTFRVKRITVFVALIFILLMSANSALACSCFTPGLSSAIEDSKNIAVFSVQSVEKYVEGEKGYGYDGFKQAILKVEKVYKGNLKVGDTFPFKQGGGGDCIITYDEKSVGNEFLFFLGEKPEKDKLWEASGCNRSNSKKYASADLLYLEKMSKVEGKTRLSGTLTKTIEPDIEGKYASVDFLAGKKVRISGNGKNIELKTDKNGVYEIYDLPPGKYIVTPEKINGFKFGDDKTSEEIEIKEEYHTEQDFEFEVDNRVSGKIFDSNGKPLRKVCLGMFPVQGVKPKSYELNDCTDSNGYFEFKKIPPGNYVITINEEGEITADEPFGTFYYPNVFKREEAAQIAVQAGTFFDNLNIKAPQTLETITISGVLRFADGNFADDENAEYAGVYFINENDARSTEKKITSSARIDANGRFTLKILKGQKGKFYGKFSAYLDEYENCPKLNDLIRDSGERSLDIKTQIIEIEATSNLSEVELTFPLTACKRKYR